MFDKKNPFDAAIKSLQDEAYSSTELGKLSGLVEGIKQLQDFKNIFSVTNITAEQAVLFSMARTIGKFWDIPEIETILEDLATMRLSVNGKRAEQIVEVLVSTGKKKDIKDKVRDYIRGGEEQ